MVLVTMAWAQAGGVSLCAWIRPLDAHDTVCVRNGHSEQSPVKLQEKKDKIKY